MGYNTNNFNLYEMASQAAQCAHQNCESSKQNATQALSSAQSAYESATNAAASATAAAASAAIAGIYLGPKATAPTTDNEGGPLQEGMLYYNTVSNVLFVWNGSAWVITDFNEFTNFTATGTTTPRNLVTRMADVVNVKDFGAVGDGVADDTAAIQAALDHLETAGGGTLIVPRPSVYYNLGTTGIDIPSYVSVVCIGNAGVISGKTQFTYFGTDAAIRMKDGEGVFSGTFRSISISGLGVELKTPNATGFRIRHGRDGMFECCVVRMIADNQIGFHLQGEKELSVNLGVFDCKFIGCISYTSSAGFAGALHYKLSGVSGQGQCNANAFFNCRGGGSGKGVEIGPSNVNVFYACEFEAITGDCFDILANAYENAIHDLYVEAQSGWTGVIMRTDTSATRNYLNGYVAGNNVDPDHLSITAANYARWSGLARVYSGSTTNGVLGARVVADTADRFSLRPDGLRFGDGFSQPTKEYSARQMTVVLTDFSSGSSNLVTPDASVGLIQFIRMLTGSSGVLTINNSINTISDGDTLQFNINNTSGGDINLVWDAAYIRNEYFPTSITNGQRITLQATRMGSFWYLMGAPITMG